ncbi:MAG: GNAT family N-acetyltransferase [Nocardioides sp.]
MEITTLDPHSDLALRAAYDIERRAMLLGREGLPHWSWQEMSVAFRKPDSGEDVIQLLGYVDGRPVAYGVGYLPLLDNVTKCWFEVTVDPEAQHRGHGRALLERLTDELVARGRTELLAESKLAFDEVQTHRYRRFAEAAGYTLSNVEIVRHLQLPVDGAQLAAWSAQAAERHDGYRIETFVGDIPDAYLPSLCLLYGQLVVDAPTGEADWDEEVITPERFLESRASLSAAGRRMYETLAIAPDDSVAAQTTVSVPPDGRTDVSQWGTFVHRDHRGRRLGLAVKAANLLAAQEAHPAMKRVVTQNAETNDWMVAINEQMGFEPVEASVEFIKRV